MQNPSATYFADSAVDHSRLLRDAKRVSILGISSVVVLSSKAKAINAFTVKISSQGIVLVQTISLSPKDMIPKISTTRIAAYVPACLAIPQELRVEYSPRSMEQITLDQCIRFSKKIQKPSMDTQFDGETYNPSRDYERLHGQWERVYDLMKDRHWRTLKEVSFHVRAPETSCSARLRDLRKEKFGGHTVERRHRGNGIHEYRLHDE